MITPKEAEESHERRRAIAHEMHIKFICDKLDNSLVENYHIISRGLTHPLKIGQAIVTHGDAEEILPKYRELGWDIDFKNGNFILNEAKD